MLSGPRARLTCSIAVLTAALLRSSALLAQQGAGAPPEDEAARLAEAERACLEGNYQRGIEVLAALYLTSRHPAYLHNQARCYEQNGQYRQAAGRYREFLHKLEELPPGAADADARLSPEKVATIEARAARLEQLALERAAGRPSDPPVPAAERPAERGGDRPAGAGWRGTGVALIAVGGLALAGSAAAGYFARKAEEDISDASSRGGARFDASQYRNGERAARAATVGFIAAPAAALVGALLYWKGASVRSRQSRAGLQLTPTFARGALGGRLAVSY